jgi:cation diffusion facilitator CzcD-associated flavoprotein CzcO
LCGYAERFGVLPRIRFNTTVVSAVPSGAAWRVELADADGTRVEEFAQVVICTGQFSKPRTLELADSAAFVATGGMLIHSSLFHDAALAADKDVVILGYSKSATDVAMQAVAAGAKSVTMVYRSPTWKLPYYFGNLVNFKNILYCRVSEVMFMPWAPSKAGRIGRMLAAPAIWANWRALESLLTMQFGLTAKGLRPTTRIEDDIHCGTSIETPGFYKAIAAGKIRMVQGTLTGCAAGGVITDKGDRLPAELVVLAIGWLPELPFLDAATRAKLIEPDGLFRLHRMIVNPDIPGLGFVGFNSSFITTLSAEVSAHWLVRWFGKQLQQMPTPEAMRASIALDLGWKRTQRPVAATFSGLCIAPYHFVHFDELLGDMGARKKPRNPIVAHLLPINPKHYAALLASAPRVPLSAKETTS